jgi:uncharacterized protein (DUF1499 family)
MGLLNTSIRRAIGALILLAAVALTLEVTMPFSAKAGSRLAPCPDSPNCVSSLADDGRHTIAPLPLPMHRSPEQSLEGLKQILGGMKRTRIVTAEGDYLHAEFRTLLGFVDDLEVEIDRSLDVFQVRSASRLGYWDLGVNRRRLESIRRAFESRGS